jgi:hypothetical protein
MSIVEAISKDSALEITRLTYTDIQLAKARRYVVLYDRLQFENPKLSSAALCEKIGISKQSIARYRQALGAPKRTSHKSTEEQRPAYAKGMLTKAKNDAYKKFLSELQTKKLSYEELKKEMTTWEQAHDMDIQPTPVPGSSQASAGRKPKSVKGGGLFSSDVSDINPVIDPPPQKVMSGADLVKKFGEELLGKRVGAP